VWRLNGFRKACLFICIFIYREEVVSSVLIEKVTQLSKTDTDFTMYDLTRVRFHFQCNYLDY